MTAEAIMFFMVMGAIAAIVTAVFMSERWHP